MKDIDQFEDSMTAQDFYESFMNVSFPGSEYGFHLSQKDLEYFKHLPDNYKLPVQIMTGSSMTLGRTSEVKDVVKDLVKRKAILLFLHSPFVISPWRNFEDDYVSRFYSNLNRIWQGVDVQGVVLHVGYNQKMSGINKELCREAFSRDSVRLIDNLNRWQNILDFPLLLENLAGSSKYKINPASIESICKLISSGALSSRVGICYDSEHSYASGDSVDNIISLLKSMPSNPIKLCHCNGCPSNVKHGSHIDLHSYTSVRNSVERVFSKSFWDLDRYREIFKGIPKVFERSPFSILLDDYVFMNDL